MAGKGTVVAMPMQPLTVEDASKEELNERLQRDGYLLLRGFLDTSKVLKVMLPGGPSLTPIWCA